jgi:hypothetical protein
MVSVVFKGKLFFFLSFYYNLQEKGCLRIYSTVEIVQTTYQFSTEYLTY